MKRRSIGFFALPVAVAIGCAIGWFAGDHNARMVEHLPTAEPQQAVSRESSSAPKPRYRLAGYEGKLAVFIVGKSEPELTFDIYLHHLPDVDRLRLQEGIEAEDYTQLLRMIEDFTG